ncbi:3-hydroxyacyl-CoA dehydrogenase family protein [Sporomusa termitida]|uniref:L-carnitine dehydrogenase n=1 Tax=Sporomusa termitida TaxID=2377 RepID=A0A517DSK2_9FIRM|nr:3-hydroxyacyl-CoA dehydrogenase family protein [Sporomusa termitida]QDR80288.1 L-carnitine dehydrogenase [Sporomusa termitida]
MEQTNIRAVACVGVGVIGASFALQFAWKGYPVTLCDVAQAALEGAKKNARENLNVLIENGIITAAEALEIEGRMTYTTDLAEAVRNVQFIQESGPENYGMKQPLLAQIEAYTSPDTVIATSTSGLLVTKIAEQMVHPERLIGGHPYNPPHLIPLVEVAKGEKTKDWVVQKTCAFYKSCGKEPVVLNKEVSGFISNRLQVAVYREIIDLVQNDVCSLADADRALLYGPGLRWGIMGPSMIFHLAAGELGIGVTMERQRESLDERLKDMAAWKHFPKELAELTANGIQEALNQRTEKEGRTIDKARVYRDKMLLELLKLHNKL